MEKEIWRDIPGYEGHYMASDLGRIKSLKKNKELILKPTVRHNGYLHVSLIRYGILKTPNIHRLVAQTFLGLDRNNKKMLVCHKDDIKSNNRVDNLFLGSSQDNVDDMIKKGRYNKKYSMSKRVQILQISMDGIIIKEWDYMRKAHIELGIQYGDICSCCKGKKKSAGGFIWAYKNPTD